MEDHINIKNTPNSDDFRIEIFRYLSFWPYYFISVIIFLLLAFIYLRYSENIYSSSSQIEIIDKAQDSEMALPTSMTIFNRSMINLENEIGVIKSFRLHKKALSRLNSNVRFLIEGRIKSSELHKTEWWNEYKFDLKSGFDNYVFLNYEIYISNNMLIIKHIEADGRLIKEYSFDNRSTYEKQSDLPFDLKVINDDNIYIKRNLILEPIDFTTEKFLNSTSTVSTGKDSDQLTVSFKHNNKKICVEYLNILIDEFNKDGINDRQLEYQNTIEFVNNRSLLLSDELKLIEIKKQKFKELNNLSDIDYDASLIIGKQYDYDAELFEAKSQIDLLNLFQSSLENFNTKILPLDIGLNDASINSLIIEYNKIFKDVEEYKTIAGPNNVYLNNLFEQLENSFDNILKSTANYKLKLEKIVENLKSKEVEYTDMYSSIPENEKILRSIERELEIKEKLFLLLLQKKEEAAINLAVVRPSVKIIDYGRLPKFPISPIKRNIYLGSILIGLLFPILIMSLIFFLDNKIHTKAQLSMLLDNLPIVGEIPYISEKGKFSLLSEDTNVSRGPLSESIRMLIANLNFTVFKGEEKCKIILTTSSVKGEGKTILSSNLSKLLSDKFKKVLLIGADLRNPQIHKYLDLNKNTLGLSDYIFRNDIDWKKCLIKRGDLDILLSGTIPPNPLDLLSSKKFDDFLEEAKMKYYCVVIDTAPCLLVSDTFELADKVDATLYVVRANHSDKSVLDYLNENHRNNKLKNLNIVFNSVGNSAKYGYKYGYQYGYKYGYKYGYNYGYGYGYTEDK